MNSFHGMKVLAHCGGGAYGDVYYCEDITGRKIAVKVVSKKRLGDSWERELRGVINYCKITENAPGLLQIFHVEEDDETFFYTMEPADSVSDTEYIPDTLAYRLQTGTLPQADLLRILSGIFDGIKLIHDAGFAHRDIKPDNILFVKGVPKLADIGLLSSLSNSMTQLAGTFDFIPPEERSAEYPESSSRESRQRNDLYAFGKVVYCAVTRMSPNEYPAVPKELPLSLPHKYFLRLSFQLCSRDPLQRLNSIDELTAEFADIERKLLYGETFSDKLKYGRKQFFVTLKSAFFASLRFTKRYWYLVLLFLIAGGSVAYFIKKPDKGINLADIKTKTFRSQSYDATMTIPAQWVVLSKETALNNMTRKISEDEKEQLKALEMAKELVRNGCDFILLKFHKDFTDSVIVQKLPLIDKRFFTAPDDEMHFLMKQFLGVSGNMEISIFDIKRMEINGCKAAYLYCSFDPKTRICAYFIQMEKQSLAIILNTKAETFDKHNKEFEAALQTLEFTK